MILVFGVLDDTETAYVCSRLLSRRLDFALLDTRLDPRQFGLSWSLENGLLGGSLRSGSTECDLREVRSMYVRPRGRVQPPPPSAGASDALEMPPHATW